MASSRAEVSSESSTEEGSISKLTHVVVDRIQLLPGCWPKITLSSLPHGPLHRAAHNSLLTQSQQTRVHKSKARQKPPSFCNLMGSYIPSLCCILVVRSESLGQYTLKGWGLHKGKKTKRWDTWDHLKGHHT